MTQITRSKNHAEWKEKLSKLASLWLITTLIFVLSYIEIWILNNEILTYTRLFMEILAKACFFVGVITFMINVVLTAITIKDLLDLKNDTNN